MTDMSFKNFASETRQALPPYLLPIASHISYSSVRTGGLPDDFFPEVAEIGSGGLKRFIEELEANGQIDPNELLEPTSEFVRIMSQQNYLDVFLDRSDQEYRLDQLPPNGSNLNSGFADLIKNRFKERFEASLSAGRAATCFETHINYIIGTSERLTEVQSSLIKSICKIVLTRPLPALFAAHNILQHLDEPQALRVILAASIWNKKRNVSRLCEYAPEMYSHFKDRIGQDISILFLGFSQTQLSLLNSFAGECDLGKRKLNVFVPKINNPNIEPEEIYKFIHDLNIRVTLKDEIELASRKIDFALAGSKLMSWSEDGKLEILNDQPTMKLYNSVAAAKIRSGGVGQRIPIVATAGLFKVWPRKFRSFYRDRLLQNNNTDIFSKNSVINRRSLDIIVTELGIIKPSEVTVFNFLETIDARNANGYAYFLGLDENADQSALKDSALDFILSGFLKQKTREAEASEFEPSATIISEALSGVPSQTTLRGAVEKASASRLWSDKRPELSSSVKDSMSNRKLKRSVAQRDLVGRYEPEGLRQLLTPLFDKIGSQKNSDKKGDFPDQLQSMALDIYREFKTAGQKQMEGKKTTELGPFLANLSFLRFAYRHIKTEEVTTEPELEALLGRADLHSHDEFSELSPDLEPIN